jgi:acetyl esterase/lipase
MEIDRNIEYAHPDGIPLLLDLYLPKGPGRPLPVVIWIHGGGWQGGNKEKPLVLPMAKLGFAIASISYRLSSRATFPAQIHDCKAAVRWVRANALKYQLDPDKIGVAGISAGGHLAALLGTTADHPEIEGEEGITGVSSRVQAVVDYCGPSNFLTLDKMPEVNPNLTEVIFRFLGGPIARKMDLARLASPVFHISRQACPFYIVHGELDPVVPLSQSVELNDALKKAGVPSELNVVKGGRHWFDDPASFAAAVHFLQEQLQGP